MKYVQNWKEMLLAELRKGRAEEVARNLVRVGADRVIQEKHRDPDFSAAYAEAREAGSSKRIVRG